MPEAGPSLGAHHERLLPRDDEERLAIARRLVAERCLYGVDVNPLAVEMAKLGSSHFRRACRSPSSTMPSGPATACSASTRTRRSGPFTCARSA